jgi:hypothetical protein
VVADAVAFEPVSTAEFPANREKNRDFFDFGAVSGFLTSLAQSIQGVRDEFPTYPNREFLRKNREFPKIIRDFLPRIAVGKT